MSTILYELKTVLKEEFGCDLVDEVVGKDHECNRCGHKWRSRPWRFKDGKSQPFKCPKCGSRYWWE